MPDVKLNRRCQMVTDSLISGNWKKALKLIAQKKELASAPRLLALKAHALHGLARDDEALAIVQSLKAVQPFDPRVVESAVRVLESIGGHEAEAADFYAAITREQPSNEEGWRELFKFLVGSGDYAGQAKTARKMAQRFKRPLYSLWAAATMRLHAARGDFLPAKRAVLANLATVFLLKGLDLPDDSGDESASEAVAAQHLEFAISTLECAGKTDEALAMLRRGMTTSDGAAVPTSLERVLMEVNLLQASGDHGAVHALCAEKLTASPPLTDWALHSAFVDSTIRLFRGDCDTTDGTDARDPAAVAAVLSDAETFYSTMLATLGSYKRSAALGAILLAHARARAEGGFVCMYTTYSSSTLFLPMFCLLFSVYSFIAVLSSTPCFVPFAPFAL